MPPDEVNPRRSTVTLHVVSSLDGIIAKKDNSVSWLDSCGDVYEKGVSDEDAEEDGETIDCFVLGSRTYEHALELGWPYGDTPTIVITNRELPSTRKTVEFYSGDLERLVHQILTPRYENIWLVGGALLCQSFLRLGLVDEIRMPIVPILLGDGLRLFDDSCTEQRLRLKNVVAYKTGLVELSYQFAIKSPEGLKAARIGALKAAAAGVAQPTPDSKSVG
jgi:dihydrofolate reductase